MNYITCIVMSVSISAVITSFLINRLISTFFKMFKENSQMNVDYVREMNEITFNGILDILKKKGVLEDSITLKKDYTQDEEN